MPQRHSPSSASLQAIEAAALQLLAAVRQAGNGFSVSSPPHSTEVVSLAAAFNKFLISKAEAGRSDNYLSIALKHLREFAKGREGRPAASITPEEIEQWMLSKKWSARTRKGALQDLRTCFAWCIKRGLLVANPAAAIDIPTQSHEPPTIHKAAEVKHILETARSIDLTAMRCLAIKYFAGLRTTEATALEETEIGKTHIEVTAAKAKTRRRRLVTIQPVLRAWLDLGGVLPLRQVNNRMRAVYAKAGVFCPRNVARHTFVSFHLAEFQNAGKTALEAGHTEQMLFNHYREIVTPEEAANFWKLWPNA